MQVHLIHSFVASNSPFRVFRHPLSPRGDKTRHKRQVETSQITSSSQQQKVQRALGVFSATTHTPARQCRPSLRPFAPVSDLSFSSSFRPNPFFFFLFFLSFFSSFSSSHVAGLRLLSLIPFLLLVNIFHSLVLFCAGRWKEDLRLFILHTCGLGCVALRCIRPPCILHPLDWHVSLIPSSGISILLVLASIFGLVASVPRFSSRYLLVQSPTCTVTLRLHRSHHNRPPIAANPSRSARALIPTHQPRQANLDNWCIKRQTED